MPTPPGTVNPSITAVAITRNETAMVGGRGGGVVVAMCGAKVEPQTGVILGTCVWRSANSHILLYTIGIRCVVLTLKP